MYKNVCFKKFLILLGKCECNRPFVGPFCEGVSVALVTNDIERKHVGESIIRLAKFLIQSGYTVTLVFVTHPKCLDCKWSQNLKKQIGINNVVVVDELQGGVAEVNLYQDSPEMQISYKAYKWLLEHQSEFSIIHFHDRDGIGYYTTLAKKLGIGFGNVELITLAFGTRWFEYYIKSKFPTQEHDLIVQDMETQSLQRSDIVISYSKFYLDWLEKYQNCKLSKNVNVIPQVIDPNLVVPRSIELSETHELESFRNSHNIYQDDEIRKIKELVLVGFDSKDFPIFARIVTDLTKDNPDIKIPITFLFEVSSDQELDIQSQRKIFKNLHGTVKTFNNRQEWIDYMKREGRVAIFTSHIDSLIITELISNKILFLVVNVREISEMINHSNLFEPNQQSLLKTLKDALHGVKLPQYRQSAVEVSISWWNLYERILDKMKFPEKSNILDQHLISRVSVIIKSTASNENLLPLLDSLLSQTYKNMEIIVYIEGTETEKHKSLIEIRDTFKSEQIPLKTIYQDDIAPMQAASSAWNTAAKYATSKYLLFIDGSHIIAKPEMLQTFVSIAEYSMLDVLSDFSDIISNDDTPPEQFTRLIFLGNSSNAGVFVNLFGSDGILFVRKKTFQELSGFLQNDACELWDFYARVSQTTHKYACIPESLHYTKRSTSPTSRVAKNNAKMCSDTVISHYMTSVSQNMKGILIYSLGRYHLQAH